MGVVRSSSVLVLACLAATPAVAGTPGVKVWQSTDQAITEGETLLDGDAADIYATCLDYAKWVDIFPDVAKVVITSQHGVDARVTLISPSNHRDNLHFHNQPAARMIYFEDTGNGGRAEVWAEIVFVPGEQAHTTRVHIRLYAEVHGLATLVVSDTSVRKERETKIERDLAHIRAYFHKP
jgi:hypothetical protein